VDHRRFHALVAEQFLDRPDVVAIGQEGRCEAVPKRVAAGMLRDPGPADHLVDDLRIEDVSVGRKLDVDLNGDGSTDVLALIRVSVDREAKIQTGKGSDHVLIDMSSFGRDLDIKIGKGFEGDLNDIDLLIIEQTGGENGD
jgi:hypothetical protein